MICFRFDIWEILYSFARRDSLVALSGKSGMKAAARKMPQSCIREVEEKKRNLVLGKLGGNGKIWEFCQNRGQPNSQFHLLLIFTAETSTKWQKNKCFTYFFASLLYQNIKKVSSNENLNLVLSKHLKMFFQ